jgi:hypothetical protein
MRFELSLKKSFLSIKENLDFLEMNPNKRTLTNKFSLSRLFGSITTSDFFSKQKIQ